MLFRSLSFGKNPNELWCTDYKGEFLLGNHQYCYPLTVTDHASRYLLTCEALSSTKEDYAFTVFERLFKERGLPANIRSDNGVPFASAHALFNLSKLAVWWLRLGIGIERIKPGHPQQNGRHEEASIAGAHPLHAAMSSKEDAVAVGRGYGDGKRPRQLTSGLHGVAKAGYSTHRTYYSPRKGFRTRTPP